MYAEAGYADIHDSEGRPITENEGGMILLNNVACEDAASIDRNESHGALPRHKAPRPYLKCRKLPSTAWRPPHPIALQVSPIPTRRETTPESMTHTVHKITHQSPTIQLQHSRPATYRTKPTTPPSYINTKNVAELVINNTRTRELEDPP